MPELDLQSKDEILIQLKSVKTFYLQAYNFTSFPLELTLNSGLVGFREFGSFYRNVLAFNIAQIQNIASAVLKLQRCPETSLQHIMHPNLIFQT